MSRAADIITTARTKRQLSMNGLGALVGVPPSTISRIESGKIEPTFQLVSRITSALGFSLGTEITESGSDAPLATFLNSLPESYDLNALAGRFSRVARLAPIAKRKGGLRFEAPDSLETAVETLTAEGQSPIISSLEAFNNSIKTTSSFIPILYVESPATVKGLTPAARISKRIMFLLQATPETKKQSRRVNGVTMVNPAWGMLDALASPGRQADAAMELIGQKSFVTV